MTDMSCHHKAMYNISMAQKGEENDRLDERSQPDPLVLPDPGSRERLLAERKLVRKLDMRLLPTILIIYIVNYIDVCCCTRLP